MDLQSLQAEDKINPLLRPSHRLLLSQDTRLSGKRSRRVSVSVRLWRRRLLRRIIMGMRGLKRLGKGLSRLVFSFERYRPEEYGENLIRMKVMVV